MDTQITSIQLQHETSTIVSQASGIVPMRIVEVELGQALSPISAVDAKTGQHYQRARCIVRLHSQPLGEVEIPLAEPEVSAGTYASQVWLAFHEQINEHLRQDGLPSVTGLDAAGLLSLGMPRCLQERADFLTDAPFVSVIVSTRDRPERLQLCLRSLLALEYPHYEVIVVDNAPSTNATAELLAQSYRDVSQVRYLREDHPGLSWARNRGMMVAKGEILAFTDDDVIVDRYWLVELVKGFTLAEDVACVTGLVLPLELETAAQFWFEEYGGFSKGFSQRIFDMKEHRPEVALYPYIAGRLGTGASMAFRATFLCSIDGFDPALGAGSLAQGGEDIAAFFQVVINGHKLVYNPASMLYHPPHADHASLRKQMYHYGTGFTAYLTKCLLANPRLLFDFLLKLPYGLYLSLSPRSPKNSKKSRHYPKELTRLELKGMIYGPLAYMQSRWALHHIRNALVYASQASYVK